MDLAMLVYAVSLLDKIHGFLVLSLIITTALTCILYMYRFSECSPRHYNSEKENEKLVENGKWATSNANKFIVGGIIASVFLILIPTEKTAYMMVGAYAAQKVSESGQVAEVSSKIMKVVNSKLDQYVEDAIDQSNNAPEPKRKR